MSVYQPEQRKLEFKTNGMHNLLPSATLRLEAYFAAVEKWADVQGAVSLEEG